MTPGGVDDETATPVIAFDYAFMSEKNPKDQRQGEEDQQADEDEDEEIGSDLKMLIGRDKKSNIPCAISVPRKGVDRE